MPRFVSEKFPSLAVDDLGSGFIVDVDVNASGDFLIPSRKAKKIAAAPKNHRSLYVAGCEAITDESDCLSFASGLPGCRDFIFRAGDGAPKVKLADCAGKAQWCDWTFPCPTRPPKLANLGSVDAEEQASEHTSVVYTYVNEFGWESGPSIPSNGVKVSHGNLLRVTDILPASASACIKEIRVYTFHAGPKAQSSTEKQVVGGYMLAATIKPNAVEAFVKFGVFRDGLTTIGYEPVPGNIRLIAKAPHGLFAGLVDNTIAFSTSNVPWSWPTGNRMVFYGNAVALAMGEAYAYVLTDGKPFAVDISTKDCKDVSCRKAQHTADPLPCIAPRSVAMRGDSCIFATVDGLVELSGLKHRYLIKPVAWQWQNLWPHEMIGVVAGRVYYGFTSEASFAINLDTGFMSELSLRGVRAATVDGAGIAYVLTEEGVFALEQDVEFNRLRYRIRLSESDKPMTLTAYRVLGHFGRTTVSHFADAHLLDTAVITDDEIQRLPRMRARTWEARIETDGRIDRYAIAHGSIGL